jgi:hypothetical protein
MTLATAAAAGINPLASNGGTVRGVVVMSVYDAQTSSCGRGVIEISSCGFAQNEEEKMNVWSPYISSCAQVQV